MIRPARGTRPANRRELILAAAAELFYEKGYANVGMSDIADAVAVGPSALYRHFSGKQELLEAVINGSFEASARVLSEIQHGRDAMAQGLAIDAIGRRHTGVLWWREARQVPEVNAALRPRARELIDRMASLLAEIRPGLGATERTLLAHCVFGAATSVSFHNLQLPDDEFVETLVSILQIVIDAPIPQLAPLLWSRKAQGLRTVSKRETLLTAAAELFARHGYANVAMEQIGAHIGITGSSVYTYFPGKDDILEAALTRGAEWLRFDLTRVFASARGPSDALRRLLHSYCGFVLDHPDSVHLLLTEVVHLSEPAQARFRESQADYISDWEQLVALLNPATPPVVVRMQVHAVLAVMNDVAISSHLRRYSNVRSALSSIGMAILAPKQ